MLFIKNCYLIDPASDTEGMRDIVIHDGRFLKIGKHLTPEEGAHVIDASGLTACPGLIDTHSHFRDPGFTYKEDLASGARAAVKGGYTSVLLMANTKPSVDCPEVLKDILERGREVPVHLYSCANVTRGMAGKELTDLKALADCGAKGFTDDGVPVMDSTLLEQALRRAKALGLPVSLHEEDKQYITENGIHGGGTAAQSLGLTGSPREAEYTLIARDVEIAASLEATPHHFSLTEDAILRCGTLAKVNPPLRTERDRMAIIRGLQDGTIDLIATDHAPHAADEKEKPFVQAPSGMIGLETALSLAIRHLVQPGHLTMMQMLACLTCNPADFYHLPAGRIEAGAPADLTLFAPDEHWIVRSEFASKSCNSPFIGEILPGVVHYTIVSGSVVYRR